MIAPPQSAITAAAIAFAIALSLTPVVRALCIRLQIFDAPGPLKIHTHPIPRLGGAAIFIAIFATVAFATPRHGRPIAAFLAAFTLVWLAGFLDDLHNLSPAIRVAAQIIAGAIVWTGGWRITVFGNSFLGLVAVCVAVPVMANALNLFDGLDALAAGTSAIIGAAYLVLPPTALSPLGFVVAASIAGSCLGFLPYNWPAPSATIFLGDEGSTLLGFAIAFLATDSLCARSATSSTLLFAMLVVAVPLIDAIFAAIRRLRNHRSALQGDRAHLYDLQLARNGPVLKTLTLLCGVTALLSSLGLLLIYRPSGQVAAAAAALVGILITAAIRLGSVKKESVPRRDNLPMGAPIRTRWPS
jgi:UDP-GlcNAc:undecaprenyl-phosphate GlcNAc-1-phosphate transferase